MAIEHRRAYIVITESGLKLALSLKARLGGQVLSTKRFPAVTDAIFSSFSEMTDHAFKHYDQLVFFMAVGIVVRGIAPYIRDKYSDPAVVVVDDLGKNAISFLSGHIGGANALTLEIAKVIGAHPVITTATDNRGKGAFELYLRDRGIDPEPHRETSKWVNAALVADQPVWVIDEEGTLALPSGCIRATESILDQLPAAQCIYIGIKDDEMLRSHCRTLIPETRLIVGLGFRKGKTAEDLKKALETTFRQHGLHIGAVKAFATIALKAQEAGLMALSQSMEIPVIVIPESAITAVGHLFTGSAFVEITVGVSSVSEPCAYLASDGNLIIGKTVTDGVTLAIGKCRVLQLSEEAPC